MKQNIVIKGSKRALVENRSFKLRTGTVTHRSRRFIKNYDRARVREDTRARLNDAS